MVTGDATVDAESEDAGANSGHAKGKARRDRGSDPAPAASTGPVQGWQGLLGEVDGLIGQVEVEPLRWRYLSPQVEQLLGYPLERWASDPQLWRQVCHPGDLGCVTALWHELAASTATLGAITTRCVTLDGRIVRLHLRLTITRDEAGRPVRWTGLAVDLTGTDPTEHDGNVTKLLRAERTLQASLTHLGFVHQHIPEHIVLFGVEPEGFRVLYLNPAATEAAGRPAEEVIGLALDVAGGPEPLTVACQHFRQAVESGEPVQFAIDREVEGRKVKFEVRALPLRDEAGQLTRLLAVGRDVTEQVELQEARVTAEAKVREVERLEAIRRLAGGIAHSLNNHLTAITGYGEMVLAELPAGHPWHVRLRQVVEAGDRAAGLVQQLLSFGRRQLLTPQLIQPDRLLQEAEPLLRDVLGPDIALYLSAPPGLPAVRVDVPRMQQVLVSLATNARRAMPDGGAFSVRATAVDWPKGVDWQEGADSPKRPGWSKGGLGPANEQAVRLEVHDTGVGMDDLTKAHVFEPFFTTQPFGRDAGLGLSSTHGIVTQSGGTIEVDSQPGAGTTFRIHLPAELAVAHQPPRLQPPRYGPPTVLVAEDDAAVRLLLTTTLRRLGVRVLEAADGVEALQKAAAWRGPIDLLLTDLDMPRMGGRELADQLTARTPGLQVAYLSGHAHDPQAGALYLTKPVTPSRLAACLDDLLGTSRERPEPPNERPAVS